MKQRRINRSVSFIERNGVYVFYLDFSFIFIEGGAASIMKTILEKANIEGVLDLNGIPNDFVDFLVLKKIVTEEA